MPRYLICPSFAVSRDGADYDLPHDERRYARPANSRETALAVIKHIAGEYTGLADDMRLGVDIQDTKLRLHYEVFADNPGAWRERL